MMTSIISFIGRIDTVLSEHPGYDAGQKDRMINQFEERDTYLARPRVCDQGRLLRRAALPGQFYGAMFSDEITTDFTIDTMDEHTVEFFRAKGHRMYPLEAKHDVRKVAKKHAVFYKISRDIIDFYGLLMRKQMDGLEDLMHRIQNAQEDLPCD
ncbi:hypothetical protein ACFL96_07560 [Thermoproteota archaeon]